MSRRKTVAATMVRATPESLAWWERQKTAIVKNGGEHVGLSAFLRATLSAFADAGLALGNSRCEFDCFDVIKRIVDANKTKTSAGAGHEL